MPAKKTRRSFLYGNLTKRGPRWQKKVKGRVLKLLWRVQYVINAPMTLKRTRRTITRELLLTNIVVFVRRQQNTKKRNKGVVFCG